MYVRGSRSATAVRESVPHIASDAINLDMRMKDSAHLGTKIVSRMSVRPESALAHDPVRNILTSLNVANVVRDTSVRVIIRESDDSTLGLAFTHLGTNLVSRMQESVSQ